MNHRLLSFSVCALLGSNLACGDCLDGRCDAPSNDSPSGDGDTPGHDSGFPNASNSGFPLGSPKVVEDTTHEGYFSTRGHGRYVVRRFQDEIRIIIDEVPAGRHYERSYGGFDEFAPPITYGFSDSGFLLERNSPYRVWAVPYDGAPVELPTDLGRLVSFEDDAVLVSNEEDGRIERVDAHTLERTHVGTAPEGCYLRLRYDGHNIYTCAVPNSMFGEDALIGEDGVVRDLQVSPFAQYCGSTPSELYYLDGRELVGVDAVTGVSRMIRRFDNVVSSVANCAYVNGEVAFTYPLDGEDRCEFDHPGDPSLYDIRAVDVASGEIRQLYRPSEARCMAFAAFRDDIAYFVERGVLYGVRAPAR